MVDGFSDFFCFCFFFVNYFFLYIFFFEYISFGSWGGVNDRKENKYLNRANLKIELIFCKIGKITRRTFYMPRACSFKLILCTF